jgi:hypothetical protein
MKNSICLVIVFLIASVSASVHAADSITLKSSNTYLNTAIKDISRNPLTSAKAAPVCICGGDGKGGWTCTPAGCDSNYQSGGKSIQSPQVKQTYTATRMKTPQRDLASQAICICGGDGEGGWTCRPARCDENSAMSGSQQLQKPSIDARTLPKGTQQAPR